MKKYLVMIKELSRVHLPGAWGQWCKCYNICNEEGKRLDLWTQKGNTAKHWDLIIIEMKAFLIAFLSFTGLQENEIPVEGVGG